MSDDDLKKIANVVDEKVKSALKPVRDELALVNTKIRREIMPLSSRLEVMNSRQELTNDKLDKTNDKLEQISDRLENFVEWSVDQLQKMDIKIDRLIEFKKKTQERLAKLGTN